MQIINDLINNINFSEILEATQDTLFMLGIATFFSTIIGIPLGFILYLSKKGLFIYNKATYLMLSFIINIMRSVPFIILLILMIPLTTFLVGTSLGAKGTIPPLVFGAFPFFTRLVENALNEVDEGIIHMGLSFGASRIQLIWHILLPEILPSLIASITVTAISLVAYTAMAGVVGGGGLGDMAIRYGYQRYQLDVMVITVLILIVMVQLIQLMGDLLVKFFKR